MKNSTHLEFFSRRLRSAEKSIILYEYLFVQLKAGTIGDQLLAAELRLTIGAGCAICGYFVGASTQVLF